MGFRFYRRVSLIPDLRLNACRSGGLSIGHRGAWYTIRPSRPSGDAGTARNWPLLDGAGSAGRRGSRRP